MRFPAAAGAELFNPSHIVTCGYWRHVPAMYCHGAGWRPIIARATSGSTKSTLFSELQHPARERLFNAHGEPAGRIIEASGQSSSVTSTPVATTCYSGYVFICLPRL